MLTYDEKQYITEHHVKWKPAGFRYWQHLPRPVEGDAEATALVKASHAKPALVLLHGYGAMIEHWRHTFAGLKNRYRIYALDLLGFGFSEKLPGHKVNYGADLWAKQVRDFLVHKGEGKAIIAGHSMGGMVALQFARKYPQMIDGLVLVDAAGLPDQGAAEIEGARQQGSRRISFGEITYNAIKAPLLGEMTALAISFSSEWAARTSLKSAYHDQSHVTPKLVEQFRAPLRTPNAALAYLAVTRNFADFQLPIKPGDLKLPVLILWGEFDKSMPPRVMLPRWQKLIPNAEVHVILDAGHCPQDESPEKLNSLMLNFIERVNSGYHQDTMTANTNYDVA